MRSLPPWALRGISGLLADIDGAPYSISDADVAKLRAEVDRCLGMSRSVKAARKPRAAKKTSKRVAMGLLREEVFKRACETPTVTEYPVCEGGVAKDGRVCLRLATDLDHFYGRRVPATVENCWALCRQCHEEKTKSWPSANAWLERWVEHCARYDYPDGKARARLHRISAGLSGSTP